MFIEAADAFPEAALPASIFADIPALFRIIVADLAS